MNLIVVESPAKARTIEKYLGRDWRVLASFGHVRDLREKDGSVLPDQDFAMTWEPDARGQKAVNEIAAAARKAEAIYLATDPDREGEAISWHVRDMLAEKKALAGKKVHRITFNEITRTAVRRAVGQPRDIDAPLVHAYLARRALDYLFGFTLSPVLWRKLPGSKSAGRVQSVALRLICEREAAIEKFVPREYWTVEADFLTAEGKTFTARLTHLAGKKLDQFDLANEADANRAVAAIEAGDFTVTAVETKRLRRHPPPPFMTSTLQQEASRKLRFSAKRTMQLAQKLYEGVDLDGETVGLITYMRTDGVQMAREAMFAIRDHVGSTFGANYQPPAPREYSTKAKNAQEAHEAIRPTDVARTPEAVSHYLDPDQRALYALIWKRAVASQMASAELDQTGVNVASGGTILRATGSVLVFDGFLKLYHEDLDDAVSEDEGRMLPPINQGDRPRRGEIRPEQHFTEPPPRYSEASLVRKLEELGIGRPSTYASILQVLQDRAYVRLEARRFIPEDRGRLVTAFLESFFPRWVDYNFTASLEEELDLVSAGTEDWKMVMRRFWDAFSGAVEQTRELKISDVIDALDRDLGPHFFPAKADGTDARACPACGNGRLGLRLGKFGAFIGCSNYPACQFTRRLEVGGTEDGTATVTEGIRELGHHPETGEAITLRRGPYGLYVQQGEADPEARRKPKRASLARGMDAESVGLENALALLSLPRVVGIHPEVRDPVYANIGRFGPYVQLGSTYASLEPGDDVLVIGLNRAMELLARKLASTRQLGSHPKDGEPVVIKRGRFGPYAQHGKTIANLPRSMEMEAMTLAEAVALLAEKGKTLAPRGARASRRKAPAAAEAAAAAKPARKAAAKRPARPTAKPAAKHASKPAAKARTKRKTV
ncbi:MAG: type I DNA topoisomerase [Acetobacteraceae bacterium]|nr:type I DNA topoisomerase [Acetobacteraceae bacterium]